jgi:beta-glucosidase
LCLYKGKCKIAGLSEVALDKAVERILNIISKAVDGKKANAAYDKAAHHALAREAARESMALLKNKDGILPLAKNGKIAVIGSFAKTPRFQGAGSSHINATRIDIPFDEIKKAAGGAALVYAEGYSLNDDAANAALLEEAKEAAASAGVCVIFAGLPDKDDSEGKDRKRLRLPENQNALVTEIAKVQKNVVVVLCNGSAVEMPWVHEVISSIKLRSLVPISQMQSGGKGGITLEQLKNLVAVMNGAKEKTNV